MTSAVIAGFERDLVRHHPFGSPAQPGSLLENSLGLRR